MKLKQSLMAAGVAALLCVVAGTVEAQPGGGGGGNGGGGGGGRRGGGQGGQGGGNFDPAQRLQMMMDNYRTELGFTNDTDWAAVQPLIQKVVDARQAVGFGGRGGRPGRGGGQGGGGGGAFGQQPNPERDALQKAIDDKAPTGQIKTALDKYQASQKEKQAKLLAAQAELRKVLTVIQEAQATLLGLL